MRQVPGEYHCRESCTSVTSCPTSSGDKDITAVCSLLHPQGLNSWFLGIVWDEGEVLIVTAQQW